MKFKKEVLRYLLVSAIITSVIAIGIYLFTWFVDYLIINY